MTTKKHPRIISYELNEVPWRIIDLYVHLKPNSTLAHILKKARTFTTRTYDTGELHPWTTWPTFHRGVYNNQHDIRFLNQDILTEYLPIWEVLSTHKYHVGVFGSLQSYPPQVKGYDFYIPDTFARSARTHPATYTHFQAFNLAQTQRDGAVARDIQIQPNVFGQILKMLMTGLHLSTFLTLCFHVVKEKLNPNHKTYRSILQSPAAFDFFMKALSHSRPDFCTFFTNHVAGMMHRYWKQLFPEDFDLSFEKLSPRDQFLSENILRAMDITDAQLGVLKTYAETHGYTLMIASSMGQDALDRGDYIGEPRIQDLSQFCKAIGYKGKISQNLAMQPDFATAFETIDELKDFKERVSKLQNEHGDKVVSFKESGHTLNLSLGITKKCAQDRVYFQNGGGKLMLKEMGIELLMRDQGTAYHIPEGILLLYTAHKMGKDGRDEIESAHVFPSLLEAYNIDLPSYAKKPVESIVTFLKN